MLLLDAFKFMLPTDQAMFIQRESLQPRAQI